METTLHSAPSTLQNVTSEQPKETETSESVGAFAISDGKLKSLAPGDWEPSETQILWAKGYVSAGPKASRRRIAASVNLPFSTVQAWYRRSEPFSRWMHEVCVEYYTFCNVPGIWRVMAELAVKGDRLAAIEVLLRADPAYRAAKHKTPAAEPKAAPDPALAAAAKRAQE